MTRRVGTDLHKRRQRNRRSRWLHTLPYSVVLDGQVVATFLSRRLAGDHATRVGGVLAVNARAEAFHDEERARWERNE